MDKIESKLASADSQEREAFNAWFDSEQGKPYDGAYVFAWAAWQARAALAAPKQPTQEDDERAEDQWVIDRFAKILAGVAIALKGPELPLHRHGYHDLEEVATVMRLERDLLRVQVAELQAAPKQPARTPENTVADMTEAEADQLRAQNNHLVALYDAVANLVKVKGRHNTEVAYQRLVAAFDAARDDRPKQPALTDDRIVAIAKRTGFREYSTNLLCAHDGQRAVSCTKELIAFARAVLAAAQGEKK